MHYQLVILGGGESGVGAAILGKPKDSTCFCRIAESLTTSTGRHLSIIISISRKENIPKKLSWRQRK